MSYTINKTDGTKLVVLKDGTVDITTTDLALFGKGYAGFGERLNENFVKILENFANTSAPTRKIKGQLWYDTKDNQIKVWNGSKFKPVGSSTIGTTQPTNANIGDMWFETNNSQLYVYSGSSWTLIGPSSIAGSGVTQVVADTVIDDVGVSKSILKFVTSDSLVAIVSSSQFNPSPAAPIPGFATVYKGITLSTIISGVKFQGTATNADALGGLPYTSYLKKNVVESTTESLSILNDSGLNVGAGGDLSLGVAGDDVVMKNITSNGDIIFKITRGPTDTTGTTVMTLDGGTASVSIPQLTVSGTLTVTGTQVVMNTQTLTIEDNIIELNRGVSSAAGMPTHSGIKVNRNSGNNSAATEQDLYWVWDESFADDGTSIYGNAGGAWTAFKSGGGEIDEAPSLVDIRANVVHARATQAQYADLAERYAADEPMEVGDVVILGGNKEITKSTIDLDNRVFGVISEQPAFLMNKDAGNNDSHPMVALKGRVRVKLEGIGNAGDRVVASDKPGVARVANLSECTAFNVLGRLIQDKYNTQIELTECAIGVK